MLRGATSPGRIVLFIVGALLFAGWLLATLVPVIHQHRMNGAGAHEVMPAVRDRMRQRLGVTSARMREVMPLALLGICALTALTSAGDKAISFTAGEVDQLFPGPFSRRQLILYKLLKSTMLAIWTGLILSIVMLSYAHWWPACFAGVLLSLLLVQWFSIVILLAGQAMGKNAYGRAKRFILVGIALLAVLGGRAWMSGGRAGGEAAVVALHHSAIGHIVLAPFEPFGNAMTATGASSLLKWCVYAALVDAGMLALVLILDSYYIEAAMGASERRYAKVQRIRSGSFLSMGVSATARWHLPDFPWTGGAGPIAWRQATNAGRSARGLLLLLFIVAVGATPVLAGGAHNKEIVHVVLGLGVWLTFLCSTMLNFDFRGDVDHIETLKALPLRSGAIAAGQLIVPVMLMTAFHWLLLGAAIAFVPGKRPALCAAAVAVLPFNAILFSAENFIFLLFPSRPAAVSPGDFQVLGRKFIFLLVKFILVAAASLIALVAAVIAWIITGKSLAISTGVGTAFLAGEAIALLPMIAWAFRRFDPSIHTPA